MTQEEELLKLIEGVKGADDPTLDEIDVRFHYFIQNQPIEDIRIRDGMFICVIVPRKDQLMGREESLSYLPITNRYTRSRDLLKAARPPGWNIILSTHSKESGAGKICSLCDIAKPEFSIIFKSPSSLGKALPTEYLAELHAIVQAWAWERKQ